MNGGRKRVRLTGKYFLSTLGPSEVSMQIDGLPKRLERDGSALSASVIGDVIMRPATVRDKVLAAVSQLDANKKIIWTLKDPVEAIAGRHSAVFEGCLPGTEWQFRVHVLAGTSPVLDIKANDRFAKVGGEELVERLYRRLLEKHVPGDSVRSYVHSEVQKQMDQDNELFRGLLNHCNRI